MIVVDLALATICFAQSCYPVLVGPTPKGEFTLTHYAVDDPKYGGDVLVFKQTKTLAYSIHRILDPKGQQREARLNSPYLRHRTKITNGCINVAPEVYEELVRCCRSEKLLVR